MPDLNLARLLESLHADSRVRERFAARPAETLRDFGFDPELLDLPSQIDIAQLEHRLAEIHRGNLGPTPGSRDISRMTADELWERFQFIRLKPDVAAITGLSLGGMMYGTTPVVGESPGAALRSFEQIKQLREMTRLAPEGLSFSVTGPDGVAVSNLNVDAMKAFLARLSQPR